MNSMLAKQAPQSSPWLPMRVRQAMQTGGKSRSASRPSTGRTTPGAPARGASACSRPISASPVVMLLTESSVATEITPLRSRGKARACSPARGEQGARGTARRPDR